MRFGPFELDVRAAELRKHGHRIRLQAQPFQILHMLLECPGDVVLREEIRTRLWPHNTVVEFDHSINTAVNRLRDALGDSADKPRYIETLSRRGYRFIGQMEAPVEQPVTTPLPVPDAPAGDSTDRVSRPLPRRRVLIPIRIGALVLMTLAGAWYYHRAAPARWVREVALPEATRLVESGNDAAVFPLLYQALQILPQDPALNRLRRQISHPVPIRTSPSGAKMYVKPYVDPNGAWVWIGKSPLENFLLPMGYYRWRITKAGFRTYEGAAGNTGLPIEFILDREGSIPDEMVHVPGGSAGPAKIPVDDFWMDKYEVTNRQFKQFVDHGGYGNRRYWRHEFVREGRVLSWEEAMAQFRDTTGRAGPSTWEVGSYAAGKEDFPVGGVSWYEAAAYAEFANKQLPTVHHWLRAANPGIDSDILQFSNFDTAGPTRVGGTGGIGSFGTYDMAGNVKEWCWNAAGDRRYILGGGWNETRPYYIIPDVRGAFDRSPANGFRCVRYSNGAPSESLTSAYELPRRDYGREEPVSSSVFQILKRFYVYDRTDLNARTESLDDSRPDSRVERITFDAAYERQRIPAWLFLPRNANAPYQTVVFFPAGHARSVGTIDEAEIRNIDFLMRSGRAVLFPIYQGTFERRSLTPPGPSGLRDRTIQQCKDLLRSLDYLESRADIAHDRIGFFGISSGALKGLIALAEEPRIRAAVLAEAGFPNTKKPPEVDEINFASRLRIPVLMLNGRYDFDTPMETNQAPMFRLLGTSEKEKRHVLFDRGHRGPLQQYVKETLDWFDLYLGVVNPRTPSN